jgi:hypothetical protein
VQLLGRGVRDACLASERGVHVWVTLRRRIWLHRTPAFLFSCTLAARPSTAAPAAPRAPAPTPPTSPGGGSAARRAPPSRGTTKRSAHACASACEAIPFCSVELGCMSAPSALTCLWPDSGAQGQGGHSLRLRRNTGALREAPQDRRTQKEGAGALSRMSRVFVIPIDVCTMDATWKRAARQFRRPEGHAPGRLERVGR